MAKRSEAILDGEALPVRPGPLHGVRVLDFTMILAGPYGTRLLCDMGAEVIKVEPPAGDLVRTRRPVIGGRSRVFGHLNAGKRSVVLDLKSEAGRQAALDLAAKCDVVVENWRPGVADRLGVGYQAVSSIHPAIVYCSLSGFGQRGPSAHRPAYAPIVQAASGFDLAQAHYQGGGRPAKTGTFIGDVFGGLAAFGAIQAALYRKTQTGEGQYIDVSLLDGMLNLLIHECQEAQSPLGDDIRLYRPLKTTDSYVVVAPTSARNFQQLAHTLNHPEWLTDSRFKDPHAREVNWATLMDLVEVWTSTKSGSECENILLSAGVPCTQYKTVFEAMNDAQTQARGSLSRIRAAGGDYWVPNAPFLMPGLDTSVGPVVPELDEGSEDVLSGLLGYSTAQVAACHGQTTHGKQGAI